MSTRTAPALGCSTRNAGIGTGVHYVSLHLQPYYRRRFGFRRDAFPHAAWISERTLSLPLSAALTDRDAERVADAFVAILSRAARPSR